MTDIIERLRSQYHDTKKMLPHELCHEAADEIAGLKTYAATLARERNELTAELDALQAVHDETVKNGVAGFDALAKELAQLRAGPWIGKCRSCGHEHEAPRPAPADKDGERYRWLRDPENQLSEDDPCVSDSFFNVFTGKENCDYRTNHHKCLQPARHSVNQ